MISHQWNLSLHEFHVCVQYQIARSTFFQSCFSKGNFGIPRKREEIFMELSASVKNGNHIYIFWVFPFDFCFSKVLPWKWAIWILCNAEWGNLVNKIMTVVVLSSTFCAPGILPKFRFLLCGFAKLLQNCHETAGEEAVYFGDQESAKKHLFRVSEDGRRVERNFERHFVEASLSLHYTLCNSTPLHSGTSAQRLMSRTPVPCGTKTRSQFIVSSANGKALKYLLFVRILALSRQDGVSDLQCRLLSRWEDKRIKMYKKLNGITAKPINAAVVRNKLYVRCQVRAVYAKHSLPLWSRCHEVKCHICENIIEILITDWLSKLARLKQWSAAPPHEPLSAVRSWFSSPVLKDVRNMRQIIGSTLWYCSFEQSNKFQAF